MQIFLGASSVNQLLEARTWVTQADYKVLFADLEYWVVNKEADWGDCYIFLEVALPEGSYNSGSRNQIDMLITFQDRFAYCELKRYSALSQLKIGDHCHQIDTQTGWLSTLLQDGGFLDKREKLNTNNRFPFLLLPNLSLPDLDSVARQLYGPHSSPHIWPVGAQVDLKGQRDKKKDHRPYHLVEALDKRLSKCQSLCSPNQNSSGLQRFFHQQLTKQRAKLRSFDNISMAKTYLRTVTSAMPVLPDEWYVPELRQQELKKALATLTEDRIMEIVGAPGIGKSTFAKELIQASVGEFLEIRLQKCRSPYDVCRRINEALRGESPEGLGDETLVQYLANEPYIFWIKEYDQLSSIGLESLLQKIRSLRASSGQVQASWIIESAQGLHSLEDCCLQLTPLDNASICHILEKVHSGGEFDDPEDVVRLAQGNPRRAIRLWQSRNFSDTQVKDEFEWLRCQLSQQEAILLPVLSMAASKSPLGFTLNTLCQWGAVLLADQLPSDVQKSVESLIEKLEKRRLVDVTRLDSETFGGLLDVILPENCSMVIINGVASGLMDYALRSVSEEEDRKWQEALHDQLLQAAETNTLAHITLELNLGDLEPFLRSSFRFTFLRRVLAWIDGTQWKPANIRQVYLLKALRILTRIRAGEYIDVEAELGAPQNEDKVQRFAFELVNARTMLSSQINNAFDLPSWLLEVEQCPDLELQAEMLVATAMSLQHSKRSQRAQDAWDILNNLWERYHSHSTAKCLSMYQALAYLNRTKVRKGVVTDEEAYFLIQTLSRELIETGIKLQNIQLVCDGLFYFVRSQEFRKGRTAYSEVLGYRAAMKFVEEAQGKTVMRLQILLTQGSIHRHFCRQDNLTWGEFQQNLDDGFECYLRAFKSALAQKHIMHTLNATAYMTDFCLKALRFVDNKNAGNLLLEKIQEVIEYVHKVKEEIALNIQGEEEQSIFANIQQTYPILFYIITVSYPTISVEAKELLKGHFKVYVKDILNKMNTRQNPNDWLKTRIQVKDTLNKLHRALNFGQQYHQEHYSILMQVLCLDLKHLLEGTRKIKEKGKPLIAWQKLSAIVPAFSAYNLSKDARDRLLKTFPSKHKRVIAHHATHEFGIPFNTLPPSRARARVVGYACDASMEVAVIEINGSVDRPDGNLYHVTLSLDPLRRKPVDAIKLLRKGWKKVKPFPISVWPTIN